MAFIVSVLRSSALQLTPFSLTETVKTMLSEY
jgi:hypothetical protein